MRADLVVDLGEHAVVGGLQLALFLIVVGRLQERMVDHHAEQRMLRAFLGAGRGAHRRGNRRGIEHRVVRRGREERRMRAQERHVREPTAGAGAPAVGPLDEPVGEEPGLRVLGVVLRAPAGAGRGPVDERAPLVGHVDAVGAHPFEPLERLALGEVAHRIEAGQHALVAVQAGVVGRDRAGVDARVGVAEQRGLVAEAAGDERDVVVAGVERRAVQHRPVVHQVHARVERGPARPAGRGLGEMAPERDPARGQPVEVRGAHDGVRGRARGSRPATGRR